MKILRPEEVTEFPNWDRDLTPEELKEAYALARAAFTAADLAEFFQLDEGVPLDDVLTALEKSDYGSERKPQ